MGEPHMKPVKEKYSYADYLDWDDGERWELINGEAWNMSPAPNRRHQQISMLLSVDISNFLKGQTCEVYAAPFDVRFPSDKETADNNIFNVVQPDLVVVCDRGKLDDRGCIGAPDLVVEIQSPSTSFKDESQKFLLYEQSGVREYWLINPMAQTLMVYILDNGKFELPICFRDNGSWDSLVLKGFTLQVSTLFNSL